MIKIHQPGFSEEMGEQRSIELSGPLQSHGSTGCCGNYGTDDENKHPGNKKPLKIILMVLLSGRTGLLITLNTRELAEATDVQGCFLDLWNLDALISHTQFKALAVIVMIFIDWHVHWWLLYV